MKSRNRTGIIAAICMLIIILDTKTALSGAQEGLNLCIITVIPVLLPFFFLSIIITSALTGNSSSILRSIGRLLRIPEGSESLFLIGALGGYPTGAQAVSQAYFDGFLRKEDANRMLGFCSNAGPAFLFGIAGRCFSDVKTAWILWIIHLLSALLVGMLLPGGNSDRIGIQNNKQPTISTVLRKSLSIMAQVCGWVILFRVLMAFLNRWILWFAGAELQIFLNGLMELTNGCTALPFIQSEGLRFIFCSVFIAFGGLCVTMQTKSVTNSLGFGMYLPGKFLQSCISFLASALYQQATFRDFGAIQVHPMIYLTVTAVLLSGILILQKKKKSSRFSALNVV